MRFVTFLNSKNQQRAGILVQNATQNTTSSDLAGTKSGTIPGTIIDIRDAIQWLNSPESPQDLATKTPSALPLPFDMLDVIREQDVLLPALKRIVGYFQESQPSSASQAFKFPKTLIYNENQVRLVSPIPHPLSMRDGYAFRQHVETARRNRGLAMIPEFDQFPVFYFTNHLAVTGPGDVAVRKLTQDKLDFELEVAVVIGKECRNVSAADADQYIFGFMVMNDWSARTLQMEEMKLNLGPAKGKDFATSLGPYLVTRDELSKHVVSGQASNSGESHNLWMKAYVNGKQLSEGNLKDMNWTFAQLIERVSYGVTLQPGEVIGSGTVGTGCLLELNGSKITDNLWLKPGDEVIMEVEALGRLENRVLAADE
ncbi:MAG: fumarylacetoacetate hydrolase family protein [Bdellovibrionia bacterium]